MDEEEEFKWDGVVEDYTEDDGEEDLQQPVVSPSAVDGLVRAFGEAEGTAVGDAKLVVRPAEELVQTVIPVAPKFSSIPTPVVPPPGADLVATTELDPKKTQPVGIIELVNTIGSDPANAAGVVADTARMVADATASDGNITTLATAALNKGESVSAMRAVKVPEVSIEEGSGRRPISALTELDVKDDSPTVDTVSLSEAEQRAILKTIVDDCKGKYQTLGINLGMLLGRISSIRCGGIAPNKLEVQYVSAMVIQKFTNILDGDEAEVPPLLEAAVKLGSALNVTVRDVFREIVAAMRTIPMLDGERYDAIYERVLQMTPPNTFESKDQR